jgi:hypothetical protein
MFYKNLHQCKTFYGCLVITVTTTLSIRPLDAYAECCYAEYNYYVQSLNLVHSTLLSVMAV